MRLNRYQKSILRLEKRKDTLQGKGLYVYKNNTSGDLILPRPTKSGVTRVGLKQEFQGDDYYMFMVRSDELRLLKVLEQPDEQQVINEFREQKMDEKLITEQPPVVTTDGTVEYVQQDTKKRGRQPQRKLNENQPQSDYTPPDVLLNENPLEGIEVL